jgi:hypothetical protein
MLAFTSLAVTPCAMAREEESLAPAAHEEARMFVRVKLIAPLMLARLLGRVPLPLSSLSW